MPIIGGGGGTGGSGAGTELDYVEQTAATNITVTTDATATAWVTGNSITLDGSTSILVTLFAPAIDTPNIASGQLTVVLYDGATDLGQMAIFRTTAAADTLRGPLYVVRKIVNPSAGAHQYIGKAFISAAGTGVVRGGAGGAAVLLPAFIRVTRA